MRLLRPLILISLAAIAPLSFVACNEKAVNRSSDAAAMPGGLTPEQAQKPVAKFGDHVITLGEFAQALADMPEHLRIHMQSLERRKELLRTMIDVQLLADEAKKQGLDKDPVVAEEVRQILVAWMRGKLLVDLPAPSSIAESEVRAWYDGHLDDYKEPERRRVAQIVTKDEATAKKAYDEAKTASPTQWGALVSKYSDDKPLDTQAPESAGDLDFMTGPGDSHAPSNPRVTPDVRAHAFALKDPGDVSPPFHDALGFHVLRLLVKNDAHEQSYNDVERSIRIRILQEKRDAKERAVLDEMRAQVKVEIDEGALAELANALAVEPTSTATTISTTAPTPSGSTSTLGSVSAATSASGATSSKASPTCVVDANCGKGLKCCPGSAGAPNLCAKVCAPNAPHP